MPKKEIERASDEQTAREKRERKKLVFQQIHEQSTNEHTCWFSILILSRW